MMSLDQCEAARDQNDDPVYIEDCKEAACEGPYNDTDIYIKNEDKDLKRWLKYLRWIGVKIEESSVKPKRGFKTIKVLKWFRLIPKDVAGFVYYGDEAKKALHEKLKAKPAIKEEVLPWYWGWDVVFNEIGRYHFNTGPIHRYSKWSIGITEQQLDRELKDTRWHNPVGATQILPFGEAYSGYSSIKLL